MKWAQGSQLLQTQLVRFSAVPEMRVSGADRSCGARAGHVGVEFL